MQLKITLTKFDRHNKSALASKWKTLQQNATNSIFTSWLWINEWLETAPDDLYIIEACDHEKALGLGIFCETKRSILGVANIKQWWLHKTGQQHLDQIWLEYNDFLLAKTNEAEIRNEMIQYLKNNVLTAHEFIIGLTENTVHESFAHHFKNNRTLIRSVGHLIDHQQYATSYDQNVISKNTRYQIRRTERLLSEQGKLAFNVITDSAEILSNMADIAQLHIQRWQQEPEGSGFNNPNFTNFLINMIKDDDDNDIQLAILSLNGKNIGYLINYVYQGKISFYLSALNDQFPKNIKIGLLVHRYAIEHYAGCDIPIYDFLAGDAQYKRSLANTRYSLTTSCYFRPYLRLKVEHKLRKLKAKIQLIFNI